LSTTTTAAVPTLAELAETINAEHEAGEKYRRKGLAHYRSCGNKPRREDEKMPQRKDTRRLLDEAGRTEGPQQGDELKRS
jgi:hypothetical protein